MFKSKGFVPYKHHTAAEVEAACRVLLGDRLTDHPDFRKLANHAINHHPLTEGEKADEAWAEAVKAGGRDAKVSRRLRWIGHVGRLLESL